MADQSGQVLVELVPETSQRAANIVETVAETGLRSWLSDLTGTTLSDGRIVRPNARQNRAQLIPLRAGKTTLGILEIVYVNASTLNKDDEQLLESFVNGTAIALEQDHLAEEERAAAVARASDQQISALLSSVSHDLRTPLAGVKVAVTSLLQTDVHWA